MAPKQNLRDFLMKEVTKSKIKHPETPKKINARLTLTQSNLSALDQQYVAKAPPRFAARFSGPAFTNWQDFTKSEVKAASVASSATIFDGSSVSSDVEKPEVKYSDVNSLFGGDVDSLFGDPIEKSREEVKQAKLEEFLAAEALAKNCAAFVDSEDLKGLKEDMKELLFREAEGGLKDREMDLLKRQKIALRGEISYVETQERRIFQEELRIKKDNLPAPISPSEKRQLERSRNKVERAKAGEERSTKRRYEDFLDDSNNNFDGEERLRMGRSLKVRPIHMTGHFWSR